MCIRDRGITGRKLFERFPEIRNQLWKGELWNHSYYVETIGSVSEENIRCYIAVSYTHLIMIRTYEQKEVEDLAKYGSIPIINGLTDFCHPCQVLDVYKRQYRSFR